MNLPSLLIVHFFAYGEILDLVHVQIVDILLPRVLADGFIDVLLLKVSHLCIHFWAIDA